MRLIILLLLISSTAFCSDFNVGDCICKKKHQKWECEQYQLKIIEIGAGKEVYRVIKWNKYHERFILDDSAYRQTFDYTKEDDCYIKTKCNKEKK